MHYLPYGLGLILLLIGFKNADARRIPYANLISLGFIVITLAITAWLSIRYNKKQESQS